MSTSDSLYQSFGKLSLPVDASDVDTTLRALDPARHLLIELFKSALNSELGAVWTKVTNTLPAGHFLRGTLPVQGTLELSPGPGLSKERKGGWPLLALQREGTATYEQHTMWKDKLTQSWGLHYILGTVDVAESFKFVDILTAAPKIVRMVIRDQGHWSYQGGAVQFFQDTSALASIDLKSHEGPGQAAFAGGDDAPLYLTMAMTLETVEMVRDNVDAYPDVEGTSFEIGVGGSEGIVPGLIYADSDQPEEAP